MSRQVFPTAPSPTTTHLFFLVSSMSVVKGDGNKAERMRTLSLRQPYCLGQWSGVPIGEERVTKDVSAGARLVSIRGICQGSRAVPEGDILVIQDRPNE